MSVAVSPVVPSQKTSICSGHFAAQTQRTFTEGEAPPCFLVQLLGPMTDQLDYPRSREKEGLFTTDEIGGI
jgi:hypothetical protein